MCTCLEVVFWYRNSIAEIKLETLFPDEYYLVDQIVNTGIH